MVIVGLNELSDPSQIQNEAVCISHSVNTLEKSMNSTILSPAIVEQTGFFIFGWETSLEGKLWIQTSCILLKKFCLWRRGWVNTYIHNLFMTERE